MSKTEKKITQIGVSVLEISKRCEMPKGRLYRQLSLPPEKRTLLSSERVKIESVAKEILEEFIEELWKK